MTEIDEKGLSEFVENHSLDDEVLFLKPEFEITDDPQDSTATNESGTDMDVDMDSNEGYQYHGPLKEQPQPPEGVGEREFAQGMANGTGAEMEGDQPVLDHDHICWTRYSQFEPCCISVHPKFPEVAHVAIGNCGDCCVIYDFDSNNQDNAYSISLMRVVATDDGELATLGPFEETVSCCSFSPCGNYLAMGCLDGNLLVYSKVPLTPQDRGKEEVKDQYLLLKKIEKMLPSIEWLDVSEDSELLVASGEDGILIVYQLRHDQLQIINTNHNSNIGKIITYNNEAGEKEYNVIAGCNDNNLVIATLNHYFSQLSLSKISESSYSNKTFSDEKEHDLGGNIISLCVHNKLKLCGFGTLTGNVTFVNLNKKSVIRCYNNLHKNSVESITFSNHRSSYADNSAVSNNELVISAGLDGLIVFYDVLNNCTKLNVINVGYGLTKVVVHPHKAQFAVSSVAGNVLILNAQKVLKEVRCHTQPILDLQLLNITGDYYAITVSEDQKIAMYGFIKITVN